VADGGAGLVRVRRYGGIPPTDDRGSDRGCVRGRSRGGAGRTMRTPAARSRARRAGDGGPFALAQRHGRGGLSTLPRDDRAVLRRAGVRAAGTADPVRTDLRGRAPVGCLLPLDGGPYP